MTDIIVDVVVIVAIVVVVFLLKTSSINNTNSSNSNLQSSTDNKELGKDNTKTLLELKAIALAKEKYCANTDDVGKEESEITNFEYKQNSFVLVKEDRKWKVDEFTLPN